MGLVRKGPKQGEDWTYRDLGRRGKKTHETVLLFLGMMGAGVMGMIMSASFRYWARGGFVGGPRRRRPGKGECAWQERGQWGWERTVTLHEAVAPEPPGVVTVTVITTRWSDSERPGGNMVSLTWMKSIRARVRVLVCARACVAWFVCMRVFARAFWGKIRGQSKYVAAYMWSVTCS